LILPTEHEYKYVLDLGIIRGGPPMYLLSKNFKKYLIRQGYLAFSKGFTTRVRCIERLKGDSLGKKKWFSTIKQKVLSGRVVEVETPIPERDGEDFWDIAIGKLKKERYSLDNKEEKTKWDVDFFINGEAYYFALAEVELEEGTPRPQPLDLLKPYVLYEVDLDDDRFSNKRLGDVDYSTKIYHELQENYHDNYHERQGNEDLQPD
jgi:CYTH domain-containing protein